MKIASDIKKVGRLGQRVLRARKAYRDFSGWARTHGSIPPHTATVGVYFADSDVNIYQMRQWYRPLQRLAKRHPVLILARNVLGARLLQQESGLPVAFVPNVSSLEGIVHEHPLSVILYVNQNTRNFQMMRYGNRWHVFINHGESDKMYMTTNQFKAYDYALVAGDAAKKRLQRALWNYDVDQRTFAIGRPQADYFAGDAPLPEDDRQVVLYAPTWEGDRPTAYYGSIKTHGVTLVEQLLATGRHRVVYRPHPRSGVEYDDYRAANARIQDMIAAANAADPRAQHVYDTSAEIGWQLSRADVAICDISAMVYDRLATGKPLLITRPEHPAAEIDADGYLDECEWLTAANAANIVEEIDRVTGDAAALERVRYWSREYFGDTTPGSATERFEAAIDTLLERAQEWENRSPRPATI